MLVGAFLASKHWHWAHVLVLVAFYSASVGYLVLASKSLEKRTRYQKKEATALKTLDQQEESFAALATGTRDSRVISRLARDVNIPEGAQEIGGVLELRHQLRMSNRDRGRLWRNAVPTSEIDPETGAVTVGVPVVRPEPSPEDDPSEAEAAPVNPGPLGLEKDSVVYLFEQGIPSGAPDAPSPQYLGDFRVIEQVAEREVRLEPLGQLELDTEAAQRLFDSEGPWTIYESMPGDRHELFASFNEEQLRSLLPAETVDEYLRHGGPVTADDSDYEKEGLDADGLPVAPDAADQAVSFRYRRLRRDYAYQFKELTKTRAELVAVVQATETDIEKLAEALEGAERLRSYRQEEISKLESDLASLRREQRAIEDHVSALQAQVDKAKRLLMETLQANAQLASIAESSADDLAPVASGALDVDAL